MSSVTSIFMSFLLVGSLVADENDWFRPLGQQPKAKPRRISGGESFPPLPLPATPLRRSERKREPSPPKIMGKVIWGESASFTYANGHKTKIADWNLCPADVQQLLLKAGRNLGLKYSHDPVQLSSFHGDPNKTPILFFSGNRTIKFDDDQLAMLRSYVMKGGLLFCDSPAGSPYFYKSIRAAMNKAFPEFRSRVIPLDHPFYHIFYDVEKVRYPKKPELDTPFLEGIYVGCRAGVIISKYGLGCGFDNREVPLIEEAVYYDVDSASKLGTNLVAYAVGYSNVGREEAKPELFGSFDARKPTDEFIFAQIRHEGAWNVHPGGAAALLRRLRLDTSARVSLKRVAVEPGKDDISSFGFLYLTGLDDFRLGPQAVSSLKNFLAGAGTLVINNGLGMKTFDHAVRRELKKILPEAGLKPVQPAHPIFRSVFKIGEVRYTPVVVKARPELKTPYFEGITINGDLRVIYSPYDLEAGWQGSEHPLSRGYEPRSALQLGINIVMYAMTH
ncbi:MAG: DUF4159 domain-containing protein [Planctomycetota bacterium]|nr:DUF4159 domain-containing protein [Planctomycetota bacterium]